MPETVRCDLADGVATVTLQRPEALNALDTALKTALRDLLREVADDPAVRAVVLTGSGRAFCVGQDLAEHAGNLQSQPLEQVWSTVPDHYTPIVLSLATMPKPVVAAVNGVAAGAGAAFALACDFRIVGSSAGFNMAFAAVGLAADSGSTWTLPRLVGMARAKELLLTPSTVPADRALELGLATQVVDDDAVLPTARELALRLAAGPTAAYGAIRRELAYAAGHTLAETLEFEAQAMAETGGTADHRNAVRSFLAKERPRFEGS
jgi:2-(1,2-epoxy-1,2-dihydrophenyl)acetyl-CoA isomerase